MTCVSIYPLGSSREEDGWLLYTESKVQRGVPELKSGEMERVRRGPTTRAETEHRVFADHVVLDQIMSRLIRLICA